MLEKIPDFCSSTKNMTEFSSRVTHCELGCISEDATPNGMLAMEKWSLYSEEDMF